MTLPSSKQQKKIIRIPEALHPIDHSLNLYMCTGCGDTKWGKDKGMPEYDAWALRHIRGCFPIEPNLKAVPTKTKKKITYTLGEFNTKFRAGEVPGISIKNPDAKRNIIVEYTYYD